MHSHSKSVEFVSSFAEFIKFYLVRVPTSNYWSGSFFNGVSQFSHFNDFLMYFGVFPCVFNAFHVKINAFPRIYADLALRFLVFLGMTILLFFKVYQASLGDWPSKKRARERASSRAREPTQTYFSHIVE